MNYYPYLMNMPYQSMPAKTGLFNGLLKGINFKSILNGTGKVLNVANQAIPLIKQAKPVFNNAKTMFKVMNEFKRTDSVNQNVNRVINRDVNQDIEVTNIEEPRKELSKPKNEITKNKFENSLPTFFL